MTTRNTQLKRSLARSTWVTGSWNWLLTLVSRAAEAILTVTILYATLQIFTETNPQIDLFMFLAQQIALDAGGIGLVKMANQARHDGQQESARKARTVALILMVLMGIGVVIAEIESKITTTTTMLVGQHLVTTTLNFKHAYPGVAIVIEVLLLIARGAMAIVYGFTIHDLESAQPEHHPAPASPPANEVEELVRRAISDLASQQETRWQEIAEAQRQALEVLAGEQQRLHTVVQEVKDTQDIRQLASSTDATNEVANTVIEHLCTLFAQQPTVQHTPQLAGPAYTVESLAAPVHTPHNEIAKRSKRLDPAEVDAVVHPLLNEDHSLTHRKIAALQTVPYTETVVYASVKRWRATQPIVDSGVLAKPGEAGEVS